MSDSTAPAAKVEDSEFPRVFRSYSRTKEYFNPPAMTTVLCKEIEYPPNTPDGQYQLWISDKYKKDITSEMKKCQEQLPLAWADTRADLDEFIDAEKSKNTKSIKSMLGRLQRETAFDHTEAPSFRDYWYQREDPRIQKLQAEIAAKDAQITELKSTISSLNIFLRQEKDYSEKQRIRFHQAENAGQKERIRVDRKRGQLVKQTKYQWILNNTITETLSEQDAKYEQGMKYIQNISDAFLEMPIEEIDKRTVEEFEGYTHLGLYQLMNAMRFNYTKTRVWRNGMETPGYEMSGPVGHLLSTAAAKELCEGWPLYLTKYGQRIFMLIERLKKVLTPTELRSMTKIVESIHSFMILFSVTI
jgi:hypothetical protein